jgi:hypothetical protein
MDTQAMVLNNGRSKGSRSSMEKQAKMVGKNREKQGKNPFE